MCSILYSVSHPLLPSLPFTQAEQGEGPGSLPGDQGWHLFRGGRSTRGRDFWSRLQERRPSLWTTLRGRGFRGGQARRFLQPMQSLGPFRPSLLREPQVCHLREGHDHQCSVEGCKAGRGHGCTHVTIQCANCKVPHGARAEACTAKKEARQLAWGWRSPPRPRGAITTGCMRPFVPRTNKNELCNNNNNPPAHVGNRGLRPLRLLRTRPRSPSRRRERRWTRRSRWRTSPLPRGQRSRDGGGQSVVLSVVCFLFLLSCLFWRFLGRRRCCDTPTMPP